MSLRFLTVNQMSEITGVDRRTIKKRLSGLKIHKGAGKGHYYDAIEALPTIFHPDRPDDINKQLQAVELKLENAKLEKIQIEVSKLRGEYIHIEDIAKTVEKEYSFVRSQIRAIPSKLAKPLSLVSDPVEIHERIEEVINECLTELTADTNYEQQRLTINEFSSIDETSDESSEGDETDSEA